MQSPLEDKPEILQKIGLFIVLFNLIDTRLGVEFYYLIDQQDVKRRPVLNFLESQDFSKKYEMLKLIIGDALYEKIQKANAFRNFLAHGTYGMNSSSQEMSILKLNKNGAKYNETPLTEEILEEQIKNERDILQSFHQLILDRLPKE